MQLYNLMDNYQQLLDYIDSAEELDESLLVDTLESIDEAFEDKIISIAYVIKNNDADIDTISNEIRRLQKLKQTKVNANDRLKDYAKDNMLQLDKTKIKGDLFNVSVRNNAESVEILNESALPEDAFKVTRTPDKTAIKEALKNGHDVDGATLKRTQSLQIK